jgi:hypothetical protein
MYKPDERPDWGPSISVGLSNERALEAKLKTGDREVIITRSFSSMAPINRNKRTISSLDPYTPSGFIASRSSVLKSTLVIDAYAPGDMSLMKRSREF